MNEVTDLSKKINERTSPDKEQVQIVNNQKYFKFAASYKVGLKEYVVHFWAKDFADAEEHVRAMRNNTTLDGQVYAEGNWNGVLPK